ncbi:MAG TPA: arginine deiminase-related protein [Xanthomonadales bacterium]|nr:arginine deiminase-related protein [Xanthomonadales bacterium]
MITSDPRRTLMESRVGRLPADYPATPQGVMMIEPVNFRLSEDSARDNHYMDLSRAVDPDRALDQYIDLIGIIRDAGIPVKSFAGDPSFPDSVFPNNVFGTAPKRFIIGHMLHASRQQEGARKDIRAWFEGMDYQAIDLSVENCIAELTGPLIIDRARRIGYCGMTERVDEAGLRAMHKAFGLVHTLYFDLLPGEYHTNVVMSVLAGRACVLHAPTFADPNVPRELAGVYDGKMLYLDDAEKAAFAGNCIALTQHDLFMSRTAANALRPKNRALLDAWGFRLHTAELDEIEKAGGSLRCMVAEIF